MKKNVFKEKTLEEKLQVLVNSIINKYDKIVMGGVLNKREEWTPEERRKYNYMVEIWDNCYKYMEENYVPYVRSGALYPEIRIEYNGIKYEIVKCPTDKYNGKKYTCYIFEKQRIKRGPIGESYCVEGFELSISGNDVITSFASDEILSDTKRYFEAKKETIKLLTKFKESITELSKSGLAKEEIIGLIYDINNEDKIDESSVQYSKVFSYIKNKKENR